MCIFLIFVGFLFVLSTNKIKRNLQGIWTNLKILDMDLYLINLSKQSKNVWKFKYFSGVERNQMTRIYRFLRLLNGFVKTLQNRSKVPEKLQLLLIRSHLILYEYWLIISNSKLHTHIYNKKNLTLPCRSLI